MLRLSRAGGLCFSHACVQRARAWDVKKATKLLKGTLEWRVSAGVDALLFREVQEEGATGKMARLKRPDRCGRAASLGDP